MKTVKLIGSRFVAAAAVPVIVIWASHAGAAERAAEDEQIGEEAPAHVSPVPTRATASLGAFLPFSQPAVLDQQRAYALGLGGYDSARHTGTFEAATEVRVWGPIALRGGAVYTNGDRTLRPSFGARLQLLRERRQGVDGAFGVFYRPEGLTEPEGEIESVLSIGAHAGQTYLLGNLLYGQDPEGNERDGELRLAALRPVWARFLLGFDARLRFDLGSNAVKLAQRHEATLDALIGPSATALVGPLALSLQGGGSALRLGQSTAYGAFVMMGIGTAL
jgi:hypothetical protein